MKECFSVGNEGFLVDNERFSADNEIFSDVGGDNTSRVSEGDSFPLGGCRFVTVRGLDSSDWSKSDSLDIYCRFSIAVGGGI